jgi:hypothetical protein
MFTAISELFLGPQRRIVRETAAHEHLVLPARGHEGNDRRHIFRSVRSAPMMAALALAAIVVQPRPATAAVPRTNVAQAAPQATLTPTVPAHTRLASDVSISGSSGHC